MRLHRLDRMVVEDEGEGDPVVCVHGLGGSANTWTAMMPALQRHRVLRIELPGSARSQSCEGPLSIDRFVRAAADACARLGITRAHWLGHSLGTVVCQHLAVQHPGLVRSLALLGALHAPTGAARDGLRQRARRLRDEGLAGMHAVAQQLVGAALSRDTQQRLPLAVAFVRESLTRCDPAAYAATCEALADAEGAAVERISAPVLLVTGEDDAVAPPQVMRALADRLHAAPSVRTRVLPRCGHWTPVERASECAAEWLDFTQGLGRSAPAPRPAYAVAAH